MDESAADSRSNALLQAEDVPVVLAIVRGNLRNRTARMAVASLLMLILLSVLQLAVAGWNQAYQGTRMRAWISVFILAPASVWLLGGAVLCRLTDRRYPVLISATGMFVAAAWAGLYGAVLGLGFILEPIANSSSSPGISIAAGGPIVVLGFWLSYSLLAPSGQAAFGAWRAMRGWNGPPAAAAEVDRVLPALQAWAEAAGAGTGNGLSAQSAGPEGLPDSIYFGLLGEQGVIFLNQRLDDAVAISRTTAGAWHELPDGLTILVTTIGEGWAAFLNADCLATLHAWAGIGPEDGPKQALPPIAEIAPSFDEFSEPTVSTHPSDGRVACAVRRGQEWLVVYDGAESAPYAEIAARPILFLPGGRGVAFSARRQRASLEDPWPKWFVVAGGREFGPWSEIGPLVLDGRSDRPGVYCLCRGQSLRGKSTWRLVRVELPGEEMPTVAGP